MVRPCAVPRCPGYAEIGAFCTDHGAFHDARRRAAERARNQRPNRRAARAVYDDVRWAACRAAVLARTDGACELCGSTLNVQAHHVFGVTGSDDDFDPELCAALCGVCHPDADRRRRAGR